MPWISYERNWIDVVGEIWWPFGLACSYRYELSAYDIHNIGELTRDNVEDWVLTHSGDFSKVLDFCAYIKDYVSGWATEEGECAWMDCVSQEG